MWRNVDLLHHWKRNGEVKDLVQTTNFVWNRNKTETTRISSFVCCTQTILIMLLLPFENGRVFWTKFISAFLPDHP
jgi:hypothetical protein